MKVVYGNPKTVLTLGVSLLGDIPTPFIGFVDRAKVSDFDAISRGTDASAIISRIDDAGGVIIYIENPDAAALIAGAEALEACAKLRAFADELTAQNMPVLHGMAYQLDRLLPQEPNR